LWAGGKERHIQQEWQCIVFSLQNVLQGVQGKAQAALTDSAVTDGAVTDSAAGFLILISFLFLTNYTSTCSQ